MTNYYYIDANGLKRGPATEQQLQGLVAHGIITPHTQVETDTGQRGAASQFPNLFVAVPFSAAQPVQFAQPVNQSFCTHCGTPIPHQAAVCMACGAAANTGTSGVATASLILGIFGLFAWCIPLFGLPITISGLICGIKGLSRKGHGTALAGVVLNSIGLVISIINSAIGAYLGATGQLF